MNGNSHFTVALHILAWMAFASQTQDVMTSDQIALSVNTNPVFIRRILGVLHKARLVTVQRGAGAGWQLARTPEQISLLDVYQAVESGPLFGMHHAQPNPSCPIGSGIQPALHHFYDTAEATLKDSLAQSTVADVVAETLLHRSRVQ